MRLIVFSSIEAFRNRCSNNPLCLSNLKGSGVWIRLIDQPGDPPESDRDTGKEKAEREERKKKTRRRKLKHNETKRMTKRKGRTSRASKAGVLFHNNSSHYEIAFTLTFILA